ncbi:MAG: hypothetical protein MUQ10_11255 [Anaerolineae bacterium]|nr:hypothetical protein [Anaerolineae bacterium]
MRILPVSSTDRLHATAFISLHVGTSQDGGRLSSRETIPGFNADEDFRGERENGA